MKKQQVKKKNLLMSNLKKLNNMKKFSLILGLILLTGCKSSKQSCDAYSYEIKVEHCHIDEESYCYYTVDTIRLTK
jgi:hypothetical protein